MEIQQETFAFPASAAQRRLWILSQFQGASEAYHIMGVLRVKGNFRPDIFEKCIAYVVERQESLRTTFEKEGTEVLQVVHPYTACAIPVLQLPLQEQVSRELRQPFDLGKGPLFRISVVQDSGGCYLVCCMHHIIADGWSMNIFIREVSAAYNALLHNRYPELPELDIRYSDYALWQQDLQEKGILQQQLAYWEQRLKAAPALLELPLDFPRPPMQTFKGKAFEQVCDASLAGPVHELCRRYHTTPFIVMLAAFKVLLYRYTHQPDIVVGTPVANRGRNELENIIGCFVNTVPLRTQLPVHATFAALLELLKQQVPEDLDHQQVSFEKLLELMPYRRSPSYHPLFQVMFSLEGFDPEALHWEGVETELLPVEMGYSKFDLTLTIRDEKEQFTAIWEYNTALFAARTVQQMAAHFEHILRQVSQHPLLPLHTIDLQSAAEKQQQLVEWNQTEVTWPPPYCLHEWFEQQARLTPQRTAVMDQESALTYAALNSAANRLAHYLLAKGLQRGQPVAVSMERTRHMLVALLAIMKAGGAYVPVDPAYPAERRAHILEDAGVLLSITATGPLEEELLQQPFTDPALELAPTDPVYVIYTSGSTGSPKGVRIPHAALVNFLHGMAARTRIHENDRLLAVTSLSFDIAGLELYLPLTTGATVVIANQPATHSGNALMHCLDKFDITMMQATPATWLLLLDAGWQGRPASLKILCGGEAFPRELANRLLSKAAVVWNMYGPTETTIWSAMYTVTQDNRATTVPIGKPIANTSMYILDEQLHPVPIGVNGTLYIGGQGLAIDYYYRPALTAEKFVPHPFIAGARLYNTGDRARYLPDGNILFLGRTDLQVKVNGYRVELEEPGYHLSKIKGVKQAVVSVQTDAAGMNRLVAYVVAGADASSSELLRNTLLQKLPSYMVPSLFVFMEALPLTPNGKVDRKALPEPDLSRESLQCAYVPPHTREEQVLAQIWQEVLGIAEIGVQDNFFDLGGASLQSISVVNKAAAAGLQLIPEMIFEFPSIRELALKATAIAPVNNNTTPTREEAVITADMLYNTSGNEPVAAARKSVIIESMAGYLPEKIVTSKEVLDGCANAVRFPIEKLTGVKTRRVVAANEYAFDLAVKAMEKCFALSHYRPEDMDVLIACNIFRMDEKDRLTLEPSTAVRLARHFGCAAALTFDIANACAGIFTGLLLAESFIRTGQARRVMLVSGEYLTHLTLSHQPEIRDYMDQRIAALTMGDSGLAMILEPSQDPSKGFIDLDFFTMGSYSDLCVVRASVKHNGFSGTADAIRMMEAGYLETARHALHTLIKNRWTPEKVDFLIMHQASSVAVTQTRSAINRFLNKTIATEENVIDNIQHRGNTATTTHWIALQDHILNGKIKQNHHLLLYISGSGLNIGTALYTFDDLPERIARYWETGEPTPKRITRHAGAAQTNPPPFRIKITAAAVARPHSAANGQRSAIGWATTAAQACLQQAATINRSQVGLVCYTGIHRDEHIFEPAIAAMLSGRLSINAANNQPAEQPRTVCFDIFNGNLGFLQACYTTVQFMADGRCNYALVSASEMENNAGASDAPLLGIYEGGAAWLLQTAPADSSGFGRFLFKTCHEFANDLRTWVEWKQGQPVVRQEKKDAYQQQLLIPIQELVNGLLREEGLKAGDIDYLIPPFSGSPFTVPLHTALHLPNAVDINGEDNLQSLTLPCLMAQLLQQQTPQPGQKALLISAAAGGQIGAAIYFF